MDQTTQTVELNGQTYQIGRFSARNGSWIMLQVIPKIARAFSTIQGSQDQDAFSFALISRLIGEFAETDEETFRRIQAHALSVCRRVEKGVPMPVFVPPDTFAIKELEYDLLTVLSLTSHALVFNLSPFFSGDGLRGMFPTLPDSAPQSSQL